MIGQRRRIVAGEAGIAILRADVGALAFVHGHIRWYKALAAIPLTRDWADRRLVRKLGQLLETYGHADFVTDASQYKPAL